MRRKRNSHIHLAPRFFLILLVLVLAIAGLIFVVPAVRNHNAEDVAVDPPVVDDPEPVVIPDEKVELSILCVGDTMVHATQWKAAATETGYDFTGPFTYIKPYVEAADLAICNIETTFAGDEPSGYPSFCAPDEMADAVAWAGFDLAATCNNHSIDKRLKGITRTLDVLHEKGLETVGTHYEGQEHYTITTVKGLRIGVVAATYESPLVNGKRTINGITIPDDCSPLLNTFRSTDYSHTEEQYQEDMSRIAGEIRSCREEGADIVVAYMHWGKEYGRTPNEAQTRMAQDLANAGADVIFASHPHVVQAVDTLYRETEAAIGESESAAENAAGSEAAAAGESATTTVGVPVFYSLGNFVSNQRWESLKDSYGEETARHTEEELIGRVTFTYNKTQGKIEEAKADAVPLWLDRYSAGGKTNYMLIPLAEGYETNPTFQVSGHLERATNARAYMDELIGPYLVK